ncbi:MAG: CPBP family intramembrane glutamic endopeptidase [Bacteroidota bacterium]
MENGLKKIGFLYSMAIYAGAALLLYIQTHFTIPYLSKTTGIETVIFWFIIGGLGVFLPLIITAYLILRSEGLKPGINLCKERLRFRKLSRKDILIIIAGFILAAALSGVSVEILNALIGEFDHTPSFMKFEPLGPGRYWILFVWIPYWILNIMGEELLWRGVMLPRQEAVFGKYAWLLHGIGWGIFHLAFGWQMIVTLLPLLFILPYITQKIKNSWAGVIMHAGFNGPAFIAISLGLIN